jgi:lysophospholipase L1-like esterase
MLKPFNVRIIAVVLGLVLHGHWGVPNEREIRAGEPAARGSRAAEDAAMPAEKHRPATLGNIRASRILFLGNSITLHGPSAAVGWSGNWGMAASAPEKDYVHVLVSAIARITGRQPEVMIENIADFERHYDAYDARSKLEKHLAFKPDLVIVAIGENVPALASEPSRSAFRDRLANLLKMWKAQGNPTIVVRSCFWPDQTKDGILKQACAEVGGIFVDIGELSKDESHYARSERSYAHAGVAAHPGDKGMKAIAEAILEGLKK